MKISISFSINFVNFNTGSVLAPLAGSENSNGSGDNIGVIQSATEEDYYNNYEAALAKDISAFLLNNFYPLGGIDDAIAISSDDNYTTSQKILAGPGGAYHSDIRGNVTDYLFCVFDDLNC